MRLAAATVVVLIAVAISAKAATSHCSAQEQVIFTCSTGAKTVSVCASESVSPTTGYLQYRFGPMGAPELLYPAQEAERGVIRAGRWVFAGGGGAYLKFVRYPFNYIVYTAIGRGWGQKAGVAVEKDGKLMANFPCRGAPSSELGPEFFGRAGIPDDKEAFDLP